jgi:hypothetical protein
VAYDFQIDGRVAGHEGHACRLRRGGAPVVDAMSSQGCSEQLPVVATWSSVENLIDYAALR